MPNTHLIIQIHSRVELLIKIKITLKFMKDSPQIVKIFKNIWMALLNFSHNSHVACAWQKLKSQFILLFNLFLLLFIGLTTFFGTIHGPHYITTTNFYFYLQYFQQNKRIPNKPIIFLNQIKFIFVITLALSFLKFQSCP